jgi:hypothetical protein
MTDRSMETLSQAMSRLQAAGFTSNWLALPDGRFRSIETGNEFDAAEAEIRHVVRFEGASDPDDESVLYALAGPSDDQGLYASAFGPNASAEDVEVVNRLPVKTSS